MYWIFLSAILVSWGHLWDNWEREPQYSDATHSVANFFDMKLSRLKWYNEVQPAPPFGISTRVLFTQDTMLKLLSHSPQWAFLWLDRKTYSNALLGQYSYSITTVLVLYGTAYWWKKWLLVLCLSF